MRAAVLILALVATGPAGAIEEKNIEHRIIANAAYLLTSAAYKAQNKLTIVSPDTATITKNGMPTVRVDQISACVFEMREAGSYGFSIDFNKLYGTYRQIFEPIYGANGVKLFIEGDAGAGCDIRPSGDKLCRSGVRFNAGPSYFDELLASVSFIQTHGCAPKAASGPPPKF